MYPAVGRTNHLGVSARRLGENYGIYSANSVDGLFWLGDSLLIIDAASSLFRLGFRGNFLLYSGNVYGKDGLGAARLRQIRYRRNYR
jgi:hypothetical protein